MSKLSIRHTMVVTKETNLDEFSVKKFSNCLKLVIKQAVLHSFA